MPSGKPNSPCSSVSSEVSPEKSPAQIRAEIKSLFLKNLATSPVLSRFYEQFLVQKGYKPNEAKILADRYRNFSGANMPSQTCTHIKVTGVRCNGPALRGEQFCYFHQRMHRGVRTPPQARLHPIALIEDEESIQTALMEVMNALMRNTIDLKRAALILRALHIAVKNASRVKIGVQTQSAVTEIPNFAPPEKSEAETNQAARAAHVGTDPLVRPATLNEVKGSARTTNPDQFSELEIPATAEPEQEIPFHRMPIDPPRILTAAERAQRRAELEAFIAASRQQPNPPSFADFPQEDPAYSAHITQNGQAHLTNQVQPNQETNHVGTDPLVRPAMAKPSGAAANRVGTGTPARASGPDVPGRSKTASSTPAPAMNKPNGTTNRSTTNNKVPAGIATNEKAPSKKPPLNVRQAPAPKERKIAALSLP